MTRIVVLLVLAWALFTGSWLVGWFPLSLLLSLLGLRVAWTAFERLTARRDGR